MLANRVNAATLCDIGKHTEEHISTDSDADLASALGVMLDIPTKAQHCAMDVTAAGGVKAASIAGAIFNHKDHKKGQQNCTRITSMKCAAMHPTFQTLAASDITAIVQPLQS